VDNFGFKIVDRRVTEVEPIVQSALEHRRPVEIGLFFFDQATEAYLRSALARSDVPVNTHLDQERLTVFVIEERLDELRSHIERAVRLGSTYSVIHVSNQAMTARRGLWPTLMARLGDHLESIESVCAELEHMIFVENTFHSIPFYEAFFDEVAARGFERVHQCFDLGHAKVWSDQPLAAWLDFLERQQQSGRRLHFHLHANHGLIDDHLSFVEAERRGIIGPDGYLGAWSYFEALDQLRHRFASSRKIFEVPAEEALANMDLVRRRLRS
jgi:sugar phosphate isomerase/epimerase